MVANRSLRIYCAATIDIEQYINVKIIIQDPRLGKQFRYHSCNHCREYVKICHENCISDSRIREIRILPYAPAYTKIGSLLIWQNESNVVLSFIQWASAWHLLCVELNISKSTPHISLIKSNTHFHIPYLSGCSIENLSAIMLFHN